MELTGEEQARVAQAETKDPRAYDALLQGWEHLRRETEPDTLKAITLFEKAVELDPGYRPRLRGARDRPLADCRFVLGSRGQCRHAARL